MRSTSLKLYAPFIALAMVQALFVVVAPSNGGGTDVSALDGLSADGFGDEGGFVDGAAGPVGADGFDPGTGEPIAGADLGTGPTGGTSGPGGTSPSGGPTGTGAPVDADGDGEPDPVQPGAPAPGPQSQGGGVAAAGDTSHCKGGQQTDVTFNAPPCAPKFEGDNGGATYQGVSGDKVLVIDFQCQPNEQVDAILATQGLAASKQESDAFRAAAAKYLNETYEFYGRTLEIKPVVGDCTLTPPDPAKSRQAATEVAKMQPFAVIHYAGGPETHDVWARNGIISLGGPHQVNSFYNGRRPFRYDVFIDGTQSADIIAEYYCKKLAAGTATNAGSVIHPTIGGRTTPRKLAVVVPDNGNGSTVPNAQRVQQRVQECSGKEVPLFTYASDINRATEQTRATVAGLIDAQVTTVVCMCDPIAPVFLTQGMTQNSYFPEHMLAGLGLLDFDKLGRLYDAAQWTHAFGPSHLVTPVPHEQTDASKIWRAAGNSGLPCQSCNLPWGYFSLIGGMIQGAGPNLNPLTVEKSLLTSAPRGGFEQTGGRNDIYLIKFGKDDYTAISDFREVFWDANAVSTIDNQRGAYVNIDDGRRYELGQLNGDFKVAPKAS